MAKKTVKVGLKTAGTEPAAGDVNISYKGSRIAGLSESSTAVLETENTIVEDNIEVEYTKPAGESDFPSFNMVYNSITTIPSNEMLYFVTLKKQGDKWIAGGNPLSSTHYVPVYTQNGNYTISGLIASPTDKYIVTINGIPVDYNDEYGGYNIINKVQGYNTNVSIVIADKPNNH